MYILGQKLQVSYAFHEVLNKEWFPVVNKNSLLWKADMAELWVLMARYECPS